MKTDQLIHALAQDLQTQPLTVTKTVWRVLPFTAILLLAGWLSAAGMRGDALTTGLLPTVTKLGLGSILTLVGAVGAVRLSRPDASFITAARWLVVIPIIAALAAGAEWLTLGGLDWQARLFGHGPLSCLAYIPLLAFLPLISMLLAMRRGASTMPLASGAFAGLGAAGIAIIAYGLFCTENSAFFVGTWYLLAGCIAGAIGALLGYFALRW